MALPSLTQLGYVVAVARHGSFSRAAEACHVTQPTLSMQLGKLERALGVTLFDRSRQPVVPTDVGAQVVAQARTVLREAARFDEILAAARGMVEGELRLGVIPTLAPYLLPRFVPALARRHPRARLVVEELQTRQIVERLKDDTLDAGLVATTCRDLGLGERALFAEPFVAYVGPGHRLEGRESLTPADLLLDDTLLLADGHCFRDQVVRLCGERARPAGEDGESAPGQPLRFESGNLETLRQLAERGVGMTPHPWLATLELTHAQRRRLVPFAVPAPTRTVALVHHRAYLKRGLIEALAEELLASLPAFSPLPSPSPRRGG
jgi:LysR family hydrogen peroxide-inducible transcriptional activator